MQETRSSGGDFTILCIPYNTRKTNSIFCIKLVSLTSKEQNVRYHTDGAKLQLKRL